MAWDPFADPADAPTEPPRPPRLRLVEPKEEAEHVEAEDLQDRAVICLVGCFSHGYPYKMRGSSPPSTLGCERNATCHSELRHSPKSEVLAVAPLRRVRPSRS